MILEPTKVCTGCERELPISEFYRQKRGKYGVKASCKRCVNEYVYAYRRQHPEKIGAIQRKSYLKNRQSWRYTTPPNVANACRRYGLSPERVVELWSRPCGICGDFKEGFMVIDHDNKCCPTNTRGCGNCVRGTLCRTCNMALGLLRHDTGIIANASGWVRGVGSSADPR